MRFLLALFLAIFLVGPAQAYSYAAAGKEPLIDAREAVFKAVNAGDFSAAQKALEIAAKQIDYLDKDHDKGLRKAIDGVFSSRDETEIATVLRRAFVAEIRRRLDAGRKHLSEYQTAKVLVVKSKRFFDVISAEFSGEQRKAAEQGLHQCLAAIGNPGVFGVGRKPADPQAYEQARTLVFKALDQ